MIWILSYRLDEALFCLIVASVVIAASWAGRKHLRERIFRPWLLRALLASATVVSVALAEHTGKHERARIEEMLSGVAPLFAAQIGEAGHRDVTLSTASDDPRYLKLVELEKRWLRMTPQVADIYTLRKRPDGTWAFCVEPDTDAAQGRRAANRAPYANLVLIPTLEAALQGHASFCDEIYADKWGLWVTRAEPIKDASGKVEAVLGVDFAGGEWVSNILAARVQMLLGGLIMTLVATGLGWMLGAARRGQRLQFDAELAEREATEARERAIVLERLVSDRTRELEAERMKDRFRLGELEGMIEERTTELRRRAMHDGLTGLPNRTTFFERLQAAIRRSQACGDHHYGVLFIDFDHFKVINDSLGHDAGDALLMCIGQRLTSHLRIGDKVGQGDKVGHGDKVGQGDKVGHGEKAGSGGGENPCSMAARLGGDEFCVILEPLRSPQEALEVARRLLAALSEPYSIAGRVVQSGASIGITMSTMGYTSAEDVLRDADTAMYRAKAAGRGNVAVFRPQMHEEAMKRLVFENDLRHSLARGEMELHYQPIVSLASGAIHGAEALIRWNHAERGMVMPGDFISLAEDTGLIVEIGAWAIEQVCNKLNELDGRRGPRLRYASVNISRRQIMEPTFLSTFDDIIARTGVDPKRLVLELTESALTHDPIIAERALDGIRSRGARVYLDDFGTGLSSLGSFRRFAVDGLKLDRSFLDPTVSSRRAAAVIRSGITLARDLGIALIAEGVESLDQVALLQAMGCEDAQGYLFSRPVTPDVLFELLQSPNLQAA